MTLVGKGVLAIWNGIAPEAEDEFVAWHVREHIPERVGLPGFLRGRRYVAVDGDPKYFNFYETASADDLASPAYKARLEAPTEWTKRVVAHFIDTSLTICDVAWSLGRGEGGWIEAVQLETAKAPDVFRTALLARLGPALDTIRGIVGLHLLEGQTHAGQGDTAEKKLRCTPDKVAAWILLVEASRPEALAAFRAGAGADAALVVAGTGWNVTRGIYQQQFALTKTELEVAAM
jgi:hypothetical protein